MQIFWANQKITEISFLGLKTACRKVRQFFTIRLVSNQMDNQLNTPCDVMASRHLTRMRKTRSYPIKRAITSPSIRVLSVFIGLSGEKQISKIYFFYLFHLFHTKKYENFFIAPPFDQNIFVAPPKCLEIFVAPPFLLNFFVAPPFSPDFFIAPPKKSYFFVAPPFPLHPTPEA